MDRPKLQTPEWIERIAGEYGRGRSVALLFDYDGTLTPIVRHPSLARLPAATRHQLSRLAKLPDLRIGVISGRSLSDVRHLVGPEDFYFAGSGGLEVDLLGKAERDPQIDEFGNRLDEIQDRLQDLLRKFPGTWIERKPGALAIHYRGLRTMAAAEFRYETIEMLSGIEELQFRVVSQAIEVTPANGWDKGTAVVSILSHMETELDSIPYVVYFGDSANDLEGMAIAIHSGGLTVGIGPEAPRNVEVSLVDPMELSANLGVLAGRLAASRGLPNDGDDHSEFRYDGNDSVDPLDVATTRIPDSGMLILDPDQLFRSMLAREMSSLGWRVWQAETSEQANELLTENGDAIQVALVDLQLPGLEGARTLATMGQNHPHLIRCFISGDVSPYTANAFKRLSDLPLFVKPVQAETLDSIFRARLRTNATREFWELTSGL
jgi:trehalose 6-phosphate phosphatase